MSNQYKILYVDDEEINLELFAINFNDSYEVLTAHDGYGGLEVLDSNIDVSIVISDMKMPAMNGIEFIKKARQKYPNKKYYILTGFDITNDIEEALSNGLILEYFCKPFEIEKMHRIIAEALNG
ncbi:MAG: response regulator [Salinivirgaceae bacterium]|jgi:two-component system response regulator (stage 0 sporulation protein F)|nr:response regulator [Salinivirgaceae bacterium]